MQGAGAVGALLEFGPGVLAAVAADKHCAACELGESGAACVLRESADYKDTDADCMPRGNVRLDNACLRGVGVRYAKVQRPACSRAFGHASRTPRGMCASALRTRLCAGRRSPLARRISRFGSSSASASSRVRFLLAAMACERGDADLQLSPALHGCARRVRSTRPRSEGGIVQNRATVSSLRKGLPARQRRATPECEIRFC